MPVAVFVPELDELRLVLLDEPEDPDDADEPEDLEEPDDPEEPDDGEVVAAAAMTGAAWWA